MATNGYNSERPWPPCDPGGDGQRPLDPCPLQDDDSDEIMYMIHSPEDLGFPGGLCCPPPMQDGGHLAFDSTTPAVPAGSGNRSSAMADPSASAHHQGVGASTSSSCHQNMMMDCTRCQILREVWHWNGLQAAKLCIHGAPNVFYHATLELYHGNAESSALLHQSYIDFRGRDYLWVKQYLVDYARQRARDGCVVWQDSISAFLDVLCTGMTGAPAHTGNVGDDGQQVVLADAGDAVEPLVEQEELPDSSESGSSQPNHDVADELEQEEARHAARSRFSIQRERASKLERHDIARYFHIPMTAACEKLQIGATALKGISRKFGLKRWPYRAINAIDKQITKLRSSGNNSAAVINEIEKLTDSRRNIIDGT